MGNWTKAALLVCLGSVAGQLVSHALAAVPYAFGGDQYADRFIADGGAGVEAFIATQGSFSSRAGSGTKAYEATVNGARTDFGAGASDYASSDGTIVTFACPVSYTGELKCRGATCAVDVGSAGTQVIGLTAAADAVQFTAPKNTGVLTIGGGGTITATVRSGSVCTCSKVTNAANGVICAVATTTMTATGTAGDQISYHCF